MCPHAYFYFLFSKQPEWYHQINPTPAIVGAFVLLLWCIVPFIVINIALIRAVNNAEAGGATIEELQDNDQQFKLRFGWAVNKYRTYPKEFETDIVGDDHHSYIVLIACIW